MSIRSGPLLKLNRSFLLLTLCCIITKGISFAQDASDILEQKVTLTTRSTTISQALRLLEESIGYHFAFDSKAVNSNKKIRVKIDNQPLAEALAQILNDSSLHISVSGEHILIYPKNREDSPQFTSSPETHFSIRGRIIDGELGTPLPYATVGVPRKGMGNTANQDGIFMLSLPKSLSIDSIRISCMGYQSKNIPTSILQRGIIDIPLAADIISIQEVIIRNIDPTALVMDAVSKINQNYSRQPLYLTSFYREGTIMKMKYQNYSEAILKIYKEPYVQTNKKDEVKVLKSRSIQNILATDTLNIKLKAGIDSSLELDITKNLAPFLAFNAPEQYNYSKTDIITMDNRLAYQIHFIQKEYITDPLLTGVIYIDVESLAILGADFRIIPKHIHKVTNEYLQKGKRKFRFKPKSIKYSVRYKDFNGALVLSHVRGDLDFTYRKRRSFINKPFYLFFEMAVSHIDAENVTRFKRAERAKTNSIFIEDYYQYDNEFWEDFNYITPEQNIFHLLQQIGGKLEESTPASDL